MTGHRITHVCFAIATWLCAAYPSPGQGDNATQSPPSTNDAPGSAETSGVVLVKGQVTDSIGGGLAGVQVTIKAKGTADSSGEMISESLTDDLGDFSLRGKERLSGTYVVSLAKEHFAPFARELALKPDGVPPFVGETLEGNLTMSGRVMDGRNEQPIAHATVEISASYRDWHVDTDDEGRFSVSGLPPGSAQVTVDASGFARQKRNVPSIADAQELQVALKPQRIVRMKIVDESGNALHGVQIELIEPSQDDLRTAISDEDGHAAFSGLSADADMVVARLSYANYLSAESFDRSIRLPKDDLESEHSMTMVRAAALAGVVRDGEGKPINGARVMTGKDYSLRSARAWTDAEGKFFISGLSAGPAVLTVHRSEFAPELKIVEAKRGETVTFDLAMKPGRTVKGIVKDERGTPMKALEVVATNWRGYMTLGLRAMTDDQGRFELRDAPGDEFSVSAHAPPTSPITKLVAPGESDIAITVPYVPEYDKIPGGAHIAVGAPAPPVSLRTTDNEVIEVHKLQGKTVLFLFWTSWCGSCRSETPNLIALYEKYKNRQEFLMIGINHDEKEEGFRKFMEEHKLPWKQVHGYENGAILLGKEFGAFAYPTGYIIGPDGKMAGTYLVGKQIDAKLYELLGKPQRVRIEPARPNVLPDSP